VLRNREFYACATHWHGGGCANTINVARSVVQDVILNGIREDLSDPAVVEEFERRFNAALRKACAQTPTDHRRRIAQLEREVANVTDAIANGLLSAALAQRLRTAEEELSRLRARSTATTRTQPTVLVPNVRGQFLAMVERSPTCSGAIPSAGVRSCAASLARRSGCDQTHPVATCGLNTRSG
jgi:DNA primase